jgi:hypothetical protein
MSSGFGLGEGLAAGPITCGPMLFRTGARYTPDGGADVPAGAIPLGRCVGLDRRLRDAL